MAKLKKTGDYAQPDVQNKVLNTINVKVLAEMLTDGDGADGDLASEIIEEMKANGIRLAQLRANPTVKEAAQI